MSANAIERLRATREWLEDYPSVSWSSPVEIGRVLHRDLVIRLRGCDDTTIIPAEEFTPQELETLRKLARKSLELGGGCMPTVHLGREDEVTMRRQDGTTYTYEEFVDEDET